MRSPAREIEPIHVGAVKIGQRHRTPTQEAVDRLAKSMSEIGLQCPILIRVVETDDGAGNDVFLVAGATRLAAAKSLGWPDIDAIEVTGDDIDAEMVEIAENLHRAELTALERSEQIARWVELVEAKKAAEEMRQADAFSKQGAGRGNEGGVRAASRDLGLSEPDARRAVKVAGLSDEAKEAAREVGLDDNRTALLGAAKAEPAQQAAVIRGMAEKRQADRNSIDQDAQARAAREVAEMLVEHVPGDAWDALKANLYAAKDARRIANELTNIAGQSIMDRRYGA